MEKFISSAIVVSVGIAVLGTLAIVGCADTARTRKPCAQVMADVMAAPLHMSALKDGGLVALDLEKVIVIATDAIYEMGLGQGLAPFKMEKTGECKFELPLSGKMQIYNVYQGKPVLEIQ